ncbi:D,D-heptose 1,7-bisphosphate phosphatase [Prevotella sp. ne3005]|uniref:HAD-IIIA family hydrolase n=1 Tax=Prevotella sp. ne3005 TaxID=1761887 RepID=UPI0008CC37E7|nr:HAD-IIIA family hydrolase [Prevotella sp. ne3005]SEM53848.1 D,D-heptose 1,7-bisphosphate phosphatase [Prevotella sp. ne3005]
MKIVIIAGGQGTRIASVNSEIPKAMIPVCGKPIVEHEVELCKRYGFADFLFIIGHMGDQISSYFGDGKKWDVNIEYYQETQPLGTAGALGYLKEKLTEDFFVFYGDTIIDFDMRSMLNYHKSKKADATLFLHPNDHPYDSDIVDLDAEGKVRKFFNKPHEEGFVSRNIVNAALFIFSPKILTQIEVGVKSHIEKNVLPRCLDNGMNLYGYVSFEYIKDMGTPERYYAVCDDVKSGKVSRLNRSNKRPAIFLDRDGTISREVNLLNKPEQLELIEGAAEAIRLINKSDYLSIIVTNQPVIARNLCSIEELEYIHASLETMLGKERAYMNAIYYCPHHPDRGYPEERPEYKIDCECRKPKPGMLLQAAKDWNIDLSKSYMIGDSDRDLKVGQNAGCKDSIIIKTNEPNALLNAIKEIIN